MFGNSIVFCHLDLGAPVVRVLCFILEARLFALAYRAYLPGTVDFVFSYLFSIFAYICAQRSAAECRHLISCARSSKYCPFMVWGNCECMALDMEWASALQVHSICHAINGLKGISKMKTSLMVDSICLKFFAVKNRYWYNRGYPPPPP